MFLDVVKKFSPNNKVQGQYMKLIKAGRENYIILGKNYCPKSILIKICLKVSNQGVLLLSDI